MLLISLQYLLTLFKKLKPKKFPSEFQLATSEDLTFIKILQIQNFLPTTNK